MFLFIYVSTKLSRIVKLGTADLYIFAAFYYYFIFILCVN